MKRSILLSAAMVIATSATSTYAEKEEKVRWSQLPASVQKTMTDNAGGGKIEEIEKETKTKDGKTITVYEAEVKKSGGRKSRLKLPKKAGSSNLRKVERERGFIVARAFADEPVKE